MDSEMLIGSQFELGTEHEELVLNPKPEMLFCIWLKHHWDKSTRL